MTEYPAIRDPNRCPSHPGAVLADIVEDLPNSKTALAAMLGISRQHFYDLLTERKPLSPAMSVRVAKLFGGTPESWLRMQAAHDLWHAKREVDVSNIPTITAA